MTYDLRIKSRYRSLLLEERRRTLKEKLAKKDRKKEKRRKKLAKQGGPVPVELEVSEKSNVTESVKCAICFIDKCALSK